MRPSESVDIFVGVPTDDVGTYRRAPVERWCERCRDLAKVGVISLLCSQCDELIPDQQTFAIPASTPAGAVIARDPLAHGVGRGSTED